MKRNTFNYLIGVLGLIPLVVWSSYHLNTDLWYDEVYSLENFALQDFSKTLFYYPAPNNHIFFNLTSQLISRIFNFRDAFLVCDNVYVFRLFQLVISLLTAYYTYLVAKLFFNKKSGLLIYMLLLTTIPFINFSLQLRGYNMSSLFLIMMIYYTWNYIQNRRKYDSVKILLSVILIVYTIPSNLYFVLAIWLATIFMFFISGRMEIKYPKRNYLYALLYISLGVVASVVLYLPVLEDVVFNKYAYSEAPGYFFTYYIIKTVIPSFLSKRYALLLFIIPVIVKLRNFRKTRESYYFIFLLATLTLPFVISFFHQKIPYQRVFVPLAPVFSLILAAPILSFIDGYSSNFKIRIWQFLISIYCLFVFVSEIKNNEIVVKENLENNNELSHDVYRNYYLGDFFKQDSVMKYLATLDKKPVVLFNLLDKPSASLYLRKNNIKFTTLGSIEELTQSVEELDDFYLLTSTKNSTLKELEKITNLRVSVLTKEYLFTNIIEVRRYKD